MLKIRPNDQPTVYDAAKLVVDLKNESKDSAWPTRRQVADRLEEILSPTAASGLISRSVEANTVQQFNARDKTVRLMAARRAISLV